MYLKNLKIIMDYKNIKTIDMQKETGIARSSISRHRNGNASGIDFETLEKMLNYLDCTLDELFGTVPYVIKHD